ncbi:MAG: DUF3800 domain-containing protein [Anaerohalosphaera sp.]|nr:DUF3800 domain-containing protein [Anaerohalosphaera sp.]
MMSQMYNIYCDESCHLENDGQRAMVLGAIWASTEMTRKISLDIKHIKERHKLSHQLEIKWTKVSNSKYEFYHDLVEYFFSNTCLHFRALIVPDKSVLNHDKFPGQDHDLFYYKMYFQMLHPILRPDSKYRIYIDIKDTLGISKQLKLHEVLCNKEKDFQRNIIERVQQIRSHESAILQLTDLLIGAVSYVNRGCAGNAGKERLVKYIQDRTNYNLTSSTFLRENKFNLFCWQGQEF